MKRCMREEEETERGGGLEEQEDERDGLTSKRKSTHPYTRYTCAHARTHTEKHCNLRDDQPVKAAEEGGLV